MAKTFIPRSTFLSLEYLQNQLTPRKNESAVPYPSFQIFKDKSGKFRFRLHSGNTQVVLQSQGYKTKAACKVGVNSVKKNAKVRSRYDVNQAKNGKYFFNLVSGNKEIVGTSQMYSSRDTLGKGIASVMRNAKSPIEEV